MRAWWFWLAACGGPAVLPREDVRLPSVVPESSGLVVSQKHPGVWWTHNDSGGSAALYAVSPEGALLGTVRVDGARAVDWEDLAWAPDGRLWVADTGNNLNARTDLTLYGFQEPDPVDGSVAVEASVVVRFPDQTAFPSIALRNFDAEALFWADETLWIASKHRSDLDTTLYRVPALSGDVVMEKVGTFTVGGDPDNYGGMVTAADTHPSERFLALLTYHAVFIFRRPDAGAHWLAAPVATIALDQAMLDQCEGIAWDGWTLVLTNERRQVFRIEAPFHQSVFP